MCVYQGSGVSMVSLTSCPLCACVHTLTPSHLLLWVCPPPGVHPILSAFLCLKSRHSIPWTPCMYCMQRGTLFRSFTMETRRVLIPSSCSKPAQSRLFCLLCEGHGCLRTGVQFSAQAVFTTSFSSRQCLYSE